jgi:hypothetical protein
MATTSTFRLDDNSIRCVLDQHVLLNFHKISVRIRHVAPLGHFMIPSQLVCVLAPLCFVLSREAADNNVIVFGLTRP